MWRYRKVEVHSLALLHDDGVSRRGLTPKALAFNVT